MKKTLVALAALVSVTAFAQTSVKLLGNIDAGYQSNDYKGNKISGINNNGSATSQIDIEVIEDLGGGLKAKVWLESDINPVAAQANSGFASSIKSGTDAGGGSWLNSEQKVGLAGNFGEVAVGVVNNKTLAANGTGQPFGTAIASGYGSIIKASAGVAASTASVVRFDNSVRYDTPVVNGFSGSVYYVAKQAVSNGKANYSTTLGAFSKAGINEYSVNYSNGPVNATYVIQQADYNGVVTPGAVDYNTATAGVPTAVAGTALTTKSSLKTLSANYAWNAFTFGATTQSLKDDASTNAVNTKATLGSVKYTMGATMLGLTSGSLTNSVTNSKSTFLGYGAQYQLSKTTRVYAQFETLNDDGGTVAAVTGYTEVGTKRTRSGLGVNVAF
jgi:predicted porin